MGQEATPASTLPTLEPRGVVMLDRYTASAATRGAQSRASMNAPLAPQALETGDFGIVEPIL